jgi:hypothetical protein
MKVTFLDCWHLGEQQIQNTTGWRTPEQLTNEIATILIHWNKNNG